MSSELEEFWLRLRPMVDAMSDHSGWCSADEYPDFDSLDWILMNLTELERDMASAVLRSELEKPAAA